MRQQRTIIDLLLEELPEDLAADTLQHLRGRATRGARRKAAELASVLADYVRTEQDATNLRSALENGAADRNADVRASLAGKSRDIDQFTKLYHEVRRNRGQELRIAIYVPMNLLHGG